MVGAHKFSIYTFLPLSHHFKLPIWGVLDAVGKGRVTKQVLHYLKAVSPVQDQWGLGLEGLHFDFLAVPARNFRE